MSTDQSGSAKSGIWRHPFVVLVFVLFLVLILVTAVIAWSAKSMIADSYLGPGASLMLLRILQVTLGLVAGFALVPIGVVLAWFGINGDINLAVDNSQLKGKLITTSPGVLLFICGTVLIHAAISARVEITDDKFHAVGAYPWPTVGEVPKGAPKQPGG